MTRQITLDGIQPISVMLLPGGQVMANYDIMAAGKQIQSRSVDITDLLTAGLQVRTINIFNDIVARISKAEIE